MTDKQTATTSNEGIAGPFQGQNFTHVANTLPTYKIDFTKVKTIEDIVEIIDALDLTFSAPPWTISDKHQNLIDKGLLITKP